MPIKKSPIKNKSESSKNKNLIEPTETTNENSKPKGIDFLRLGESYASLMLGIIVVVVATVLLLAYVRGKNTNNSNTTNIQQTSSISTYNKQALNRNTKSKEIAEVTKTVTPTQEIAQAKIIINTPTIIPTSQPKQVIKSPIKVQTAAYISNHSKINRNRQISNNRIYIVQADDSLWDIAVKEYNNGYDWVKIYRANNLSNPGLIYKGNKLIIPIIEQQNSSLNLARSNQNPRNELVSAAITSVKSTGQNNIGSNATTYSVQKGDTLWKIALKEYNNGYDWVKIAQANNLSNPGLIFSGNVLTIPR